MTTAWLAPTARAIEWAPLLAGTLALSALTVLSSATGWWPVALVGVCAAVLAAASVAGLHDRAGALLAAMPTSAAVRRAQRLALLAPVALAVWLGYLGTGQLATDGLGWPVAELLALLATGVAVHTWSPDRFAALAGVAAVLVWAGAAIVPVGLQRLDPPLVEVLLAWEHHPWVVALAALTITCTGRNR